MTTSATPSVAPPAVPTELPVDLRGQVVPILDFGSQYVQLIARRVREQCSPRHVPDEVYAIAEVPRTLSGKALEVPVKRILMGTPPEQAASRDSLANPAALDWFTEFAASM